MPKTRSTGKVKDIREGKTPINITTEHTTLMLNKSNNHIWSLYFKSITVTKFLVFNRTRGAAEPGF